MKSIFTRFYEGYWLVKKFGYDKRRAHYSSLISTGQLTRNDAIKALQNSPYDDIQAMRDLEYICKKLSISKDDFLKMRKESNRSFKDYKNNSGFIALGVKAAKLLGVEKRQYR